MSKFGSRRPSPALVISILALFVALGGSAYAATKIGTKDIKANAITAGKIKKNAVTTAKIKKEAVTGVKIKESTLSAVPSATSATDATNAANWNRYLILPFTKAAKGQTVQLYSNGPFTFFGKCVDAGAETLAYTYVTTSQAGSWMGGSEGSYDKADFNPGIEAQINYEVKSAGPYSNQTYGSYYSGFTTTSPDASLRLLGNLWSAVNSFGSPCAFWGNVTIES